MENRLSELSEQSVTVEQAPDGIDIQGVQYFPEDFEFDSDIFNDESDKVRTVKYVMNKFLSPAEFKIFCMYINSNSNCSKVGKALNCSPQTANNYIKRVKNKIINYYKINEHKNI